MSLDNDAELLIRKHTTKDESAAEPTNTSSASEPSTSPSTSPATASTSTASSSNSEPGSCSTASPATSTPQVIPFAKVERLCKNIKKLPEALKPDDLLYVIYTSGSTGMPKVGYTV